MYNYRPKRMLAKEFFHGTASNGNNEQVNIALYYITHTIYFMGGDNKENITNYWHKELGVTLDSANWEYIKDNYSEFVDEIRNSRLRKGDKITSFIGRSNIIIRLEFDLWLFHELADRDNIHSFEIHNFEKLISEKYGKYIDEWWDKFKNREIYHIKNLELLAEKMIPFENKIKKVYEGFLAANKNLIDTDIKNEGRLENNRNINDKENGIKKTLISANKDISDKKPMTASGEIIKANNSVAESKKVTTQSTSKNNESPKQEDVKYNRNFDFSDMLNITKKNEIEKSSDIIDTVNDSSEELKRLKTTVADYKVIIDDLNIKISRLENDINEFQRQRDDIREYSATQYERGIKDLFNAMNSKQSSKTLDFLFSYKDKEGIDPVLGSYLENLFMAMEEVDIYPVLEDMKLPPEGINEEKMTKDYNLDFDKKNYKGEPLEVKRPGWMYKDVLIEKPTLKIKE